MPDFRFPIVRLAAFVTLFSIIQLGVSAAARAQQPSYYYFGGFYYSRYYSYGSGVYAAPALLIVSSLFNLGIGSLILTFAVLGLKRDSAQFGSNQKLVGGILTGAAAISLIFAIAGSAKWGADGWLGSYTHTRNAAVAFGIITSLATVALTILLLLARSSGLSDNKLESGSSSLPTTASAAPVQQQQPVPASAAPDQQHYDPSPMMSQANAQPAVPMPQPQPAAAPSPQAPSAAQTSSPSTGGAEDPVATGTAQGWTTS